MAVYDIISKYALDGGIIIVILLTLIQITPIKLNPWSKIASAIGKALNKSIESEIAELRKDIEATNAKVEKLSDEFHENSVIECRNRILRFGDEVSHGTNHSRDHFQHILNDITTYDTYCLDHPNFKNNITKITADRIKEDYKDKDRTNSFL